jgi:hypothetical protein
MEVVWQAGFSAGEAKGPREQNTPTASRFETRPVVMMSGGRRL